MKLIRILFSVASPTEKCKFFDRWERKMINTHPGNTVYGHMGFVWTDNTVMACFTIVETDWISVIKIFFPLRAWKAPDEWVPDLAREVVLYVTVVAWLDSVVSGLVFLPGHFILVYQYKLLETHNQWRNSYLPYRLIHSVVLDSDLIQSVVLENPRCNIVPTTLSSNSTA